LSELILGWRPTEAVMGRWGYDSGRRHTSRLEEKQMLETIAIILIILWLVGLVSSYTMGGLIHILLVIAVVVILVRVIQGRRPLG
jgi:hypothetical protein